MTSVQRLGRALMRAIGGLLAIGYATLGLIAGDNMIDAIGATSEARLLILLNLGVLLAGLWALGSAVMGVLDAFRLATDAPWEREESVAQAAPRSARREPTLDGRGGRATAPEPPFGRRGR